MAYLLYKRKIIVFKRLIIVMHKKTAAAMSKKAR